jgi:hypothetical protein
MTRRRRVPEVRQDQAFKGRQFTAEVILWAVRWYLMLPVSYRDLELMLLDRAAMRFFRKALLVQPHTVNPRTITVDKNAAYPEAIAEMKTDGELWRRSRLRQVKYLNNVVEQDHRAVRRLTRPGLGVGSFWTARRTLAGYEAMAMMRKEQVRKISGSDIRGPGNVHRRAISGRRLRGEPVPLADDPRPTPNVATQLNKVIDTLGRNRQAREIEPDEVADVIRPIYERGAWAMAEHVRSYIRSAYRWGTSEHDYGTVNCYINWR